jgi:hypothetical protein
LWRFDVLHFDFDFFSGIVFFVSAGFELLSLFSVILLYIFIYRHEKIFGELGKEQKDKM